MTCPFACVTNITDRVNDANQIAYRQTRTNHSTFPRTATNRAELRHALTQISFGTNLTIHSGIVIFIYNLVLKEREINILFHGNDGRKKVNHTLTLASRANHSRPGHPDDSFVITQVCSEFLAATSSTAR